ncbi:hypothetical protein Drorol1_Dr00019558 [Drosera rotundifolia]
MATTSLTLSWRSTSYSHPIKHHHKPPIIEPTRPIHLKTSTIQVLAQKKVKKIRKVILKEDVVDLGKKGELVKVRAGYYRNFLLPFGKANIVTAEALKEIELEQQRIEAEKLRVKEEAQQLARIFGNAGSFKMKRASGAGKQIFGTVRAQDIVDLIKEQLRRDVDKSIITVPEIREVGDYTVELQLHPEVSAQMKLTVFSN